MIEQSARVTACNADTVSLATQNTSACHGCQAQGGCGTGLLAKLFPQRLPRELQLPRHLFPEQLHVSDRVLLGISEQALHTATWLVYMLPLLGLLLGSVAGSAGAHMLALAHYAEPASILSGLLGLILGSFLLSRHNTIKNLSVEQLKVLRVDSQAVTLELPTRQEQG